MVTTSLSDSIRPLIHCPLPAVHAFSTIDSTNTYAKQLAENGAAEGTLVLAEHQTAGRGRMGRSFFSPANTGLYMSLILRPTFSPTEILSVTPCAAVAVCEAIEMLSGKKTGIKWVNDVYVGEKKVCGILTEAAFSSTDSNLNTAIRYAILGIGVNILPPSESFPEEISHIAASVFEQTASDMRAPLAAEIINRFFSYYSDLTEKNFYSGYRERLFLRNQSIEILWGTESGEGICLDVDKDFRLVVRMADSTVHTLSSGEVRVRPKGGKEMQ